MSGFRLAALLRLRKTQEDQAAAALAEANDIARRAEQRRMDTAVLLGGAAFPVGSAAALSFSAVAAARAALSMRLAEATVLVAAASEGVTAAEQEHHHARSKTKALTKLEERHDAEVAAEDARAEQIILDEIGSRLSPPTVKEPLS